MIISIDYDWCIVTPTKCATNTLLKLLVKRWPKNRNQSEWNAFKPVAMEIRPKHKMNRIDISTLLERKAKICVMTRHPFSRFVSMWHSSTKGVKHHSSAFGFLSEYKEFSDWTRVFFNVRKGNKHVSMDHIRWTTTISELISPYQHLIESYDVGNIPAMLRYIGVEKPAEIPHEQITEKYTIKRATEKINLLPDYLNELVQQWANKDKECFGYE